MEMQISVCCTEVLSQANPAHVWKSHMLAMTVNISVEYLEFPTSVGGFDNFWRLNKLATVKDKCNQPKPHNFFVSETELLTTYS